MRGYLFSILLLAITPMANSVEPLSAADAAILEQIDARIEKLETRSIQGETGLFLPRSAAVKEGDQFFVMVSSDRSIEHFDRKEFQLGDTWNADFVEVKSGLKSGDYVLVKNNVVDRQNPLTPTLVSAPKKAPEPVIVQTKPAPKPVQRITKPKLMEPLVKIFSQPIIKPKVQPEPIAKIKSKPEVKPEPIVKVIPQPKVEVKKPIVSIGSPPKSKPEQKPVAVAIPINSKPVEIARSPAKPIRARPVLVNPNPEPVVNYQPEELYRPAVEVFPIAVEVPCTQEAPMPALEREQPLYISKFMKHFSSSGRRHHPRHPHHRGHHPRGHHHRR